MNFDPALTTLAIDTSCDETSCSIIQGVTILSSVMPSQMEFHRKYGGVVPSMAKLAHQERIDGVVEEALKRAKKTMQDIDTISVTIGPGLAIALEIGVRKAKELAEKYNKPLVAVNHMEGHLLSALAERNTKSQTQNSKQIQNSKFEFQKASPPNPLSRGGTPPLEGRLGGVAFPVLGLLISGGHTEFILMRDWGEYEKVGETQDDSCGEAYDKCGRMFGLGYPAGPVISEFAKKHRKNMKIKVFKHNLSTKVLATNIESDNTYELPIAMAHSGDLHMSYSGLKTAFKQLINKLEHGELSVRDAVEGDIKNLTKEQIFDLCVVFEAAALEQIRFKLVKAMELYHPKEVWLGGGVVASARLRSVVRSVCQGSRSAARTVLRYPFSKKLTGDNAAMIGVAGNLTVMRIGSMIHDPDKGIFTKDFEQVDRDPSLSF